MMRFILVALMAVVVSVSGQAMANSEQKHPKEQSWPFAGMTGVVDRQAAQRGYQVYKEVCAACHSMQLLAYRHLEGIGFSEAEIKAIASGYNVTDGPNDDGEMFERPARPSDHFVPPFANEKASRAANGGAYPPDLSLMAKARHDGPNYIYSILTGYETPPADVVLGTGMHYNPYFPGGQIAMPPPLAEGGVTFMDGTAASVDQMAHDVVVFLQWAAEPEMEHRKAMGIKVLIFTGIMSVLFFIAMRRVWKNLH